LAVNLALALAEHGQRGQPSEPGVSGAGRKKIGLLDLDIFGPSVPKLMGLENVGEPLLSTGKPLHSLSSSLRMVTRGSDSEKDGHRTRIDSDLI
jgi:Mrp family chromosome partitioning ATPase